MFLHVWFKRHCDTDCRNEKAQMFGCLKTAVQFGQCEDLQMKLQHVYWILFLVFSDMNFTNCVLIHGCWNIGPVLCVKWIFLNIMDLLWVVHMEFITSMHMGFYFLVNHFSHSEGEGCYGRRERSVLFLWCSQFLKLYSVNGRWMKWV